MWQIKQLKFNLVGYYGNCNLYMFIPLSQSQFRNLSASSTISQDLEKQLNKILAERDYVSKTSWLHFQVKKEGSTMLGNKLRLVKFQ